MADIYPVEHYTQKWLELYKKALMLRPKRFEQFMFGVGLSGTDEERYHKGKAIWEMMHQHNRTSLFYELNRVKKKESE